MLVYVLYTNNCLIVFVSGRGCVTGNGVCAVGCYCCCYRCTWYSVQQYMIDGRCIRCLWCTICIYVYGAIYHMYGGRNPAATTRGPENMNGDTTAAAAKPPLLLNRPCSTNRVYSVVSTIHVHRQNLNLMSFPTANQQPPHTNSCSEFFHRYSTEPVAL